MRLFDAILDTNQRKLAGDRNAGVTSGDFADALPVAALTCIDPRLNRLIPEMLGLPEEHFIWLRNAGNIITSPVSSTMRSLALACAVKGAKEIAVVGHTDCQVAKTSMLQLLERLEKLGVSRQHLPENLVEYFGLFGSERQNVLRGVEFVRASPLIGNKVPVHGLIVDVQSGRLEWVVNGYDAAPPAVTGKAGELFAKADRALESLARIGNAADEELKLPNTKIGEIVTTAQDWLHKAGRFAAAIGATSETQAEPATAVPANQPPPPPKAGDPLATLQERTRQFSSAKRATGRLNPRR